MRTCRSRFALLMVVFVATVSSAAGTFTASAPAQSCDPGGGSVARSVEFANLGSSSVDVKWVNFQCGETLYTTMRGGSSYIQQTFQSHLWRFYEVGTGRLLKEERIAAQTRIEFGEPTAVTTAKPATVEVSTVPTSTAVPAAASPVPVFPGNGAPQVRPKSNEPCQPGGGNLKQDVTFKNSTASTIEVWWVSFDCTERLYATMPPGSQYLQQTYISHQWRFYEAPGGSVSKILCASVPADPQCFYATLPTGGSALYRSDVITAAVTTIEIGVPAKFDPKWKPVVKAKASGANTVVFSWSVPPSAPGVCYAFSAVVRKGSVEQAQAQGCVAIPTNKPSLMSVSVAVDSNAVTRARQTKQPLKYNASVALVLDAASGGATGLPGTIAK